MHWVIQQNISKESKFSELIANLEKFDQKYTLVNVIPFVGEITPEIDFGDEKVICFGAYSMRKYAQRKGWNPGVYDIGWFSYQDLITVLDYDVLNHDAIFGKFGDISPVWEEFFIRPTHDGKEFAGVLKSKNQLKEWQSKINALNLENTGDTLCPETKVMCSSIKKIYDERRFFVVDGVAVTGSLYVLGKRVVYQETDINLNVAQFFANKLSKYISHPYVLDIAYTDNGYKVIELNTLNCAGFYLADMQKLVNALIEREQ